MIKVTDLKIHFGDKVAVDHLSFTVPTGSVYGLIGPNGAGKTTTIKAIATLIEPTFGEIFVNQIPVLHQPEQARKHLGYMPDFPPVYDDLKVEEFCDLFAHAYGVNKDQRKKKVDECLRLTDLREQANAKCKSLSRGMKQRALLAKTLVHDPSVLLLDEPGANLDPKARIDLRNLLRRLASMGRTILVSSHILSELEDLCDSIGIMNHGTMKLSGSMDEINTSGSQTRTIQIELVEPFLSINDLLSEFPSVKKDSDWNDSSRLLELSHSGDSENAALLLSKLVTSGAKISSFHTKQSKVEDLFLEVESGRMEKGGES